eukprot:TRINITY_DN13060_c0_g1_i1.p1 TRINITY_DN13060_c0_g1~~TRINITY_DN13060_c0_g1_i1.p1  ORF type:complete len:2889 (+),score=686.18 TRINITY_DN13060_c0_g1_i1:67-8733(+)
MALSSTGGTVGRKAPMNPTCNSVMRISPSVGEFSDISCDLIYVIRFTIFNMSNKVQRVRFTPPETSVFKLITLPQSIAPGLKQEIEVEFCTKEVRDFNDSFSVITDEGRLEVPLHSWFPRPCIRFNDEVDLGVIPVQHNASHNLVLTNTGKSPGTFQFKSDGMGVGLTVAPHTGTVEPGQSKDVQVNYFGSETGLFVSVVQVILPEQSTRQLKVTACVVESKVDIFTGNNIPISGALDFGTLYYGQRKAIEVSLLNSSPFSTSFTIVSPETLEEEHEDDSRPSTPPPPPIEAIPTDGRIGKQLSAPVKLCFQPIYKEGKTGFASKKKKPEPASWRQTFGVEIVETEQKMDLVLTGRAIHTDVELSQSTFAFGEVAVNDYVDMIVTVTNNAELPVDMTMSKVAQFHVRASTYRIGPPWRLQSCSDMNLVITFKPNQLGLFSKTIHMSLCGGIKTMPIYVQGMATKTASKKKLMGGVDKTDADFRREMKFSATQQPSSAPSGQQLSQGEKPKKEYAWMTDENDEIAMLHMGEIEQRKEHQRLYNNYLTQSRLNREYNKKLVHETNLEKKERALMGDASYVDRSLVDMGMVPAEGLREPEPKVFVKEDPLWKVDSERTAGDGDGGRLLAKNTKFDENRTIKKKFKKEPTTLNEQRECKMVLSPKDIVHVAYGPRVLDFGKVSVFSTNVKSFCVQNNLKAHIQVRIPVSIRDELKHSFPASQVIPPGQTAGFDIAFKSDSEQTFTQAMWFQLNENHKLKFLLLAEAVPIDVGLSQEKMDFRFNDYVLDPTLTQNLTLTNNGNSEATFNWVIDEKDPVFSFSPAAETIPPHGQRNVDIIYAPQLSNESSCIAQLEVKGGPTKKLTLTGNVQEAKCVFNTQKIDFGSVAVGCFVQKVVTIKSLGPNSTVFTIMSLPPGLSVSVTRSRLAVNQSLDITVTLRPTQPAAIQSQIVCSVRGMKQQLKLAIKADPKIPQIDFKADEGLDFGKVIVGTREYKTMRLVNNGSIPATLLLDLTMIPDFSLTDADHKRVELTAEPEEDDNREGVLMVCRETDAEEEDESLDDFDDGSSDGPLQTKKGNQYKLIVKEKCTLCCCLAFSPTTVTQQPHTFPLLLSLLGIPVSETSHDLMKQVTAEALKPRLVLSHSVVDFGSRVVVKEGTSKAANTVSLRLTNEVEGDLEWDLVIPDDPALAEIFRASPNSGTLASGHTSSVQVSFSPAEVKSYQMKVGVCLDGDKESKYMDLIISGQGANPALTFDRREVIMTVVPLDVPSKASFVINNEGYESLDLKWRLPGAAKWNEPGTLPISLSFPDGSVVGHHHSQLVVDVTCLAKKPTSFTASIDFADDEDGVFSVPISFYSDNSVLTTYPYLVTHKAADLGTSGSGYVINADGDRRPVCIKPSEESNDGSTTPKLRSEAARSHAGSGYDTDQTNTYKVTDKTNRKAFTKKNAERLKNWMNLNVFQDAIDDLIPGMVAGHGKLLIETIEQLAGRLPPGTVKSDKLLHMNRRDIAMVELKQYEDSLSFLKGWGAMLPDVRAEYLLRFEDFQRITAMHKGWGNGLGASAPTPQTRAGERGKQRMGERKFGYRQQHAWMSLLFQIIRVFMMSKITWKSLRTMPQSHIMHHKASEEKWGTQAQDPSTMGSNLYSVSEAILLKWLTIHQQHYFPNDTRVMTFDELRDCKAFASVICGYIPTCESRLGLGTHMNTGTGFVYSPTTMSDCEKNAGSVLETAKAYGMDMRLTAKELTESTMRDLLLVTLTLFQALPQFVPQATVQFSGRLHETISKTVELTNPHRWPIDYLVLLDDESGEFKIDKADNKLRLESRSSASLPIWTCPRFSRKKKSRLTFLSTGRSGPNSASTIVFNLESEVDREHAMKTFTIETPLYEPLVHELEIENTFNERATFNITYQQQYVKEVGPKGNPITYGEEASSGAFQDAFWTALDTISIKNKEKGKISFQFIPFMRGQYTCRIVLVDDRVGEMVYMIRATGLPPVSVEKLSFQTELAVPQTKEMVLPLKNSAQEKGLNVLHSERFKGFKTKLKQGDKNEKVVDPGSLRYKVEYSSPFFTGPKEIAPKAEKGEEEGRKKGGLKSPLVLNITFQPKGPGVYPGKVTLTSPNDVRVIEVDGKSRSPGMKADLDFNCTARQVIHQELPITNKTKKDWTIHASLSGEYFTGAREVVVKAGKTKNYTLLFSPQWVCDVKGSLVLKNNETLEKYTYNLHGRADEPLAEATLTAECVSREPHTLVVSVPNITNDDVLYTIESDIPFARGASTLNVGKGDIGKYNLVLKPALSGKTTGSITFSTPSKQYIWFVAQIHCSRPPPEKSIEIETVVRKALMAEITIGNPTNQELSFSVRRRGDGLFGDNRLIVPPEEVAIYNLIYNPLRATVEGVPAEGQLSFYNDEIGEYWYNVKMTATEAAAEELQEVFCELGKSKPITLEIENPLDHDLPLSVNVSNKQNFSVNPSVNLVLKPFMKAHPVVTYMPSAIAQRQDATVTFSHPKLGKWEFIVRGKGTPPTQMEPVTVNSVVGRSQQTSVVFRNPFPLPRRFIILLKSEPESPFEVMIKRKTNTVGPFSSLTVPVSYSPQVISEHKTQVVVQAVGEGVADDLKWEYPVVGIAEAVPVDNAFKFSCRCRGELSQAIALSLHEMEMEEGEVFSHEVVFPAVHPYKRALESSLVIQAAAVEPTQQDATVKMDYVVTFTPLRTFAATVELLIRKKSGGLWRFELHFESLPPVPDDLILLEAAVAQRGSVAFTLKNIFTEEQPFRSYFTSDSPAEFTVSPAKGILPPLRVSPSTSPSTQFIVSFSSSQYGKTLLGVLVIETDLIEWRYEVKGVLPKYHAPTITASRVDTRLRNETQEAVKAAASKKTDFVKHNQQAQLSKLGTNRAQQKLLKS